MFACCCCAVCEVKCVCVCACVCVCLTNPPPLPSCLPHPLACRHPRPMPSPAAAAATAPSTPSLWRVSLDLYGANGKLTSLSECRGFRNYIVRSATTIGGITGTIQRFHADTVKVVFEASIENRERFVDGLNDCVELGMISYMSVPVEVQIGVRFYRTFSIVKDFSRTVERGGGVQKGPYSDEDADKLSVYSADRTQGK